MIKDLIVQNRSYRRFDQSSRISPEQLKRWVELARLSASGRNMQVLKYALVTSSQKCASIFPYTGWAGYLRDWAGPAETEQPVAYIVVLQDTSISTTTYCDDGIAVQSILLGAVEEGFGGCIIGSVNKSKVSRQLNLPDHLQILWLIALGKPAEKCVLEEAKNGEIKYWRDEDGVHHVPKRPLSEIIYSEE